jgi:protein tyrosine phosphatase
MTQANAACADGRARGGADGPMLVHCDLGLERSAAFVLLDIMIAKVPLTPASPRYKSATNQMAAPLCHLC